MAKTKTKSHTRTPSKDILRSTNAPFAKPKVKPQKPIEDLLSEAASLLEQSQPELALPLATEGLKRLDSERSPSDSVDTFLQQAAAGKPTLPQALTLAAEIQLALGDADAAQDTFLRATKIDPDGALISAEPWLWLAQLTEEGGHKSINYFEKATEVLRNEIEVIQDSISEAMTGTTEAEDVQTVLEEKKSKLANAMCGMTEVYMTDLSWEEDAEARCERLVTEAVAVCPERLRAGVLQTLASVRISQERFDDARLALRQSMKIWKDLPDNEDREERPDFATRVSLCRLLMEVEAEVEALQALEGLIKEDDQSVECLYLRGWCHVLIAQKPGVQDEQRAKDQEQALQWLNNCLRLYRMQEYEDERLRDHALELRLELHNALGIEESDEDENAWEDEDIDDADDLEINGHDDQENDDVDMS